MRNRILISGLCLCASMAMAQGKVDNGWSCKQAEPPKPIDVGDKAGHSYAVRQLACTSTKGEYAGIREKEGTGTEFVETTATGVSGHGVFVETMANGDKVNFNYQFTASTDGKTIADKWQATSGAGKFKGIKAAGTCKGTGNPDGSSTINCTGTYSIPAAAAGH